MNKIIVRGEDMMFSFNFRVRKGTPIKALSFYIFMFLAGLVYIAKKRKIAG